MRTGEEVENMARYFCRPSPLGSCLLLALLGLLTSPGEGLPDSGLTWHRNCSSTEDVPLAGTEGIIESPLPATFGSNCGTPLSPGICCRWSIRVPDPRLWVQIAVLDSTIPVKGDGACYRDSEVTVLDADSRLVATLCGPVGPAHTVVVKSAGAHIGFRGLTSHGAMVTLHYKVIGCDPLPEAVHEHPLVLSVRATPFTANVTCMGGHVQRYTCVGRTWNPPPAWAPCAPGPTTVAPPSGGRPNDKETGPWRDVTSLPVTTDQQAQVPDGHVVSGDVTHVVGASSDREGGHKGKDKILVTLVVVGSVLGALLTLTVLLLVLRHAGRKTRPPTPLTPDSISPPLSASGSASLSASLSASPALEQRPAYPDTYEQLDPRNPQRRVPARQRAALSDAPEVAPMLTGSEIDDRPEPEVAPTLTGYEMVLPPPPPPLLEVVYQGGYPPSYPPSYPPDDGEYVEIRGGEGGLKVRSLSDDLARPLPQIEAMYSVPDKQRPRSGLRLVENDLYGT